MKTDFLNQKFVIDFKKRIMINSHFYNHTTSKQAEKNTMDLVKLDQETTESLNNKLTEKNGFALKMEDRASNVKEICSRFHKTFNGRLGQFSHIQSFRSLIELKKYFQRKNYCLSRF